MKESLSFESFFESFEQVNSGNKYLLAIAENLSEEDRQKVILELKPFLSMFWQAGIQYAKGHLRDLTILELQTKVKKLENEVFDLESENFELHDRLDRLSQIGS